MKKILLISILVLISVFLNAQTRSGSISDVQNNQNNQRSQTAQNTDESRSFKKENLRFGGNLGAQFGDITFVDVSPSVGYQFTRRFQAGTGLTYNYLSYRVLFRTDPSDPGHYKRFSMNIFGLNPYAQFTAIQIPSFHLFLRAEYGLLNYEPDFPFSAMASSNVNREWIHYPMIGGGLLLPIGRSGGLSLQLMWDLNEKGYSIYGSNPIIRMGFMFGL
jgi:hypothetical protein